MIRQTRRGVLAVLGGSVAVSGCLGTGDDAGSADAAGEDDGDADTTAWRTAELTDVTTGEQFSVSGFDDPALVHPFAVWCSTCGSQNREIDTLQREFGGDREVVQLNIGDGETDDEVLEYAEENGYADHSRFAVAPTPVANALVEEFGPTAVSPPQSPVVLQCPGGGTHEIDKISDAETIDARIDADCE
ncbi:thioredoxin [Natronomonas moolapensis 8.8.11]|uniref:Thioredoxin n=1 Tax=Natronomonas moolapensis (strain DSM 18674 / CECT 7526 / JCM 14361 / 8.8.11) TaxID=268739 RepID=M1Y5U0_NATM8|nr:thioredoxin [Natronomonas moolapensis]CCQ37940.1 thioredoxin [Natronomonas moolapensis 8.8.11]